LEVMFEFETQNLRLFSRTSTFFLNYFSTFWTLVLENITNFKANTLHLNEFKNKTDTILNILAHDLAAPLSNIKNLSFLLGNKLKTLKEEDIYKIISSIEKNSKTGIQIINEFVKQGIAETIGIELKR